MATISKRKTKKGVAWCVQIRRKGYPTQTRTFNKHPDAKAWARDIEGQMDKRSFVPIGNAENTTLHDALDRYLKEVTPNKKGAKQEEARIDLLKRMKLSEFTLTRLRSSDIASWRDDLVGMDKAPTTIRNMATIISQVYETAKFEWGMEGLHNPVKGLPMPKHRPGRDRRLVKHADPAQDEEARLLKACDASKSHWLKPIVIIAIETGMRLGEILSIKRAHIDYKDAVIHLPDTKNGTSRDVPLSSRALDALENTPASIDKEGRAFPITTHSLEHHFKKARAAAEIENFRFHDLRHEATSRLFEHGLDIMEVSHITGHKTLDMLRRYTHLKATDLAKKLG
ncbi:site-specific integrase [Magnetovibrio sp. PR-2]|uniref:site-specific integrase n=1 Tax=Magnetovibrio sp. PR-2 TaxID=3120356 RepID=UPI002FCDE99D